MVRCSLFVWTTGREKERNSASGRGRLKCVFDGVPATVNDDALQRLEVKIAYLEHANTELSDELYRQRQTLDELRARLMDLVNRLEASAAPSGGGTADERPPHY